MPLPITVPTTMDAAAQAPKSRFSSVGADGLSFRFIQSRRLRPRANCIDSRLRESAIQNEVSAK